MSIPSWTEAEVLEALGLEEAAGDREFGGVSTDTRSLGAGDLFVALSGERYDAHDFLATAAEAGATGAVVARVPDGAPGGLRYFVVADTLRGLARLARYRRERLNARVVGVVGSNGKTTTKDLIRTVLAARYRVHATEGNLNNQIGLPLTLLRAPADAEALVLEMGTNMPGEIAILTGIARPDVAVITSIGEEHLELLGDLDGVLREEASVLDGVRDRAWVAEEPQALVDTAREKLGADRVRVAGFGEQADLRPDGGAQGVRFEADGSTRWSWKGHEVRLPLPGRYNVRNALLALGVATAWEIDEAEAAAALAGVPAPKLRGEWKRVGEMKVLADCYNSNPPSVAAAVEVLVNVPSSGSKVVVLGTMRELGTAAEQLHARTAEGVVRAMDGGIDRVVATGAFVPAFEPYAAELGSRLLLEPDPIAAFHAVSGELTGSETILLKASRGEALERWLPLLEERFQNPTSG